MTHSVRTDQRIESIAIPLRRIKSHNPRPAISCKDFPVGLVFIIILSVAIGLLKSSSLGSHGKERSNSNSLMELDFHSYPITTFYDGLGMDPYSQRPNSNQRLYKYFSPYEQRFPEYKRPLWAQKTIPYNKNVPTSKQVCFVHVGKAGGSTIGCSLGFALHCPDDSKVVPGILPIITTHVFHKGVYDCHEDAAYHLYVVRDPLTRVMSALNYERPEDGEKSPPQTVDFYSKCSFWTLDDVAQNGLLGKAHVPDACRKHARQALHGTDRELISHWFYNYQFYYEFLPQNKNILVIRNEHIVDDWNGIENILGGHSILDPSLLPEYNAYDKNSTDLYLSEESRIVLCRELCIEIQFYKKILTEAINLIEEDVHISLAELRLQCPIEAESDICDDAKPDITKKIEWFKYE